MTTEVEVPTSDGAVLWAAVEGDGPPIVLCHGGPGLWDYLGGLGALLADRFTVHRWDHRGCGRSTEGRAPLSTMRVLEDLDELRTHFGHDRWSVVGHSWGAEVALLHALVFPDSTVNVVYLSGRGTQRSWRDGGRATYKANVAARTSSLDADRLAALAAVQARTPDEEAAFRYLSWRTDVVDPVGNAALQSMVDAPFGIRVDVNRLLASDQVFDDDELDARATKCRVPTLFVHGSEDPRAPDGAARLAQLVPRGALSIIDGAGHLPWVEQPELVRSLLIEFLERHV